MEHFNHPRNIGTLENADGQARVGDPTCGDFIQVWIKVENDTIKDFKYKVYGCGAAIATTSAVSEMAIGKSFSQAIQLTDDDVVAFLDGLPDGKKHCSLLGVQGLHTAMADYLVKANHAKVEKRVQDFRKSGLDLTAFTEAAADLIPDRAERILTVGSGHGLFPIELARRNKSSVAIDPSATAIHESQLSAVYWGLDERIDFQQMDVLQNSFPEYAFDAVVVLTALHHIQQTEALLQSCNHLVSPHGLLLFGDWNRDALLKRKEIHRQNGRHCVQTGWQADKIQRWLQEQGYETNMQHDSCSWRLTAIPNL